jgi:WD40 repeat protein
VSEDGTARLWEIAPREVAMLPGATHFATFSKDGARVQMSCADGTARLLDVASAQETVLRGHSAAVRSAVFSPDGDRIVTASEDGTARVWKIEGNRPTDPIWRRRIAA